MKRLLQSGVGVALLLLLVVIGVINTAQLHNLENRVAGLEGSGVKVATGGQSTSQAVPAGKVFTARAGDVCYSSDEEKVALADPQNLLKPFKHPAGWPEKIVLGNTLKRQMASDPPGLNPLASSNAADLNELHKYFGSRVALQAPTNPDEWSPDLALKVIRSADGLTYDVHLRSGVYWQTPAVDLADPRHAWLKAEHEVVADDFKFALEILQNPQVVGRAAAMRNGFEPWKELEVVDDHHFRVHVKEDLYVNLPTLLDFFPMPRWLYMYDEDGNEFDDATWGDKQNSHWYNQKGIGSGPYQFVSWEPGVNMLLVANDRFHRAKCSPAPFARVEITMLKDTQAWLRYLSTGLLDYTHVQPPQYVNEVRGKEPYLGHDELKLLVHDEAAYFYIGWNSTRPQFTDKRVRRALTMALDRDGLLEGVFGSLGAVTSGPFDMSNACYDASIAPWPYDLTEAARLLDEAGWKDTDGDGLRDKVVDGKKVKFEFTMVIYGGSTEYENLARVYGEALQRLGIRMTPQPLEWAAQLKKTAERDFDAYTGAWVPTWEIDLYQLWHSTEADKPESSNYVSFRSPEGDRIAEALRREFDVTKRTELCHQFHALVHEEQPYTFFYQRKRAMLYWDTMNTPVISKINPHRDARLLSFAAPG